MSVIAKMNVGSIRVFGGENALLELTCVYDNDLSKSENEDVRFTKATPYGEATLTVEAGPDVPLPSRPVYLLFNDDDDVPDFGSCMFALRVRCVSKTDFGYTQDAAIEGTLYGSFDNDDCPIPLEKRIAKKHASFKMRMGIDNPVAHVQFEPTKTYWLSVYDGTKYSLDEVLAIARNN